MRPDHYVLPLHGLACRRGRSDRGSQQRRYGGGGKVDQTKFCEVQGKRMGGQQIRSAFADEHDLGAFDVRKTD